MTNPLEAFYTLAVLNPREEDIAVLRASHVDWDTLVKTSFALDSSYLFYTNIKRFGLEARINSTNIEQLQAQKERAFSNNLIQIKLFYDITEFLQAENIKFIPLKGLSLITDTYPEIGMRIGYDIDILIHPSDFDKCAEVLRKSSYTFAPYTPYLTRGVMSDHGQGCFVRSQDKFFIDIHYRFFNWYDEKYIYKIDSAEFFDNSVNKHWKGRNLAYMKKEDEFYYLLMCIFRNRFGTFRYYLDADAMLKVHGSNFDWILVKSYLWKSPLKKYWKRLLFFMQDRLKTPIPDELVLPENNTSGKAYTSLFDSSIMNPTVNKTKPQLFYLRAAQNYQDKVALVLLFLKWKLFKRFGCFRGFFIDHNNPGGHGV